MNAAQMADAFARILDAYTPSAERNAPIVLTVIGLDGRCWKFVCMPDRTVFYDELQFHNA